MRWMVGLVVGILLVAASSSGSAHQFTCMERKGFLRYLEKEYNEVVKYVAIAGRGALAEWTVAPSGSWTMLVTAPNGPACSVASGQGWQEKKRVAGPGA